MVNKTLKIIYYVHNLEFPLREGVRKQAWWLAKLMKEQGHNVEIICTRKKSKLTNKITKDNIPITYGSPLQISKVEADIIHYITHPTPLIIPLLLRAKVNKSILTMFDGHLNEFWKRPWTPILNFLINKKVNHITLQTEFQKNLYKETKLTPKTTQNFPFLKRFSRTFPKSTTPTLLFMTHMLESKGIHDVLDSFVIARKSLSNLKLIIADSGMTKNKEIYKKINNINQGDIILKKVVNPQDEMSKAWVYLYPIQTAKETFSIPLSLIEARDTKTEFISTIVGALPEFFNRDSLVPPKNPEELAKKIIHKISSREKTKLKLSWNNQQVLEKFKELYNK